MNIPFTIEELQRFAENGTLESYVHSYGASPLALLEYVLINYNTKEEEYLREIESLEDDVESLKASVSNSKTTLDSCLQGSLPYTLKQLLCSLQELSQRNNMNINDVVRIRCRGNSIFRIVFIGKQLVIVEDEYGKEYCVNIENVIGG